MNAWDAVRPFVAKYAPIIGASLGGPFGGAAGAIVAGVLGVKDADPASVQDAIKNGTLTGEQILKLKEMEEKFSLDMKNADINNAQEAMKATMELEKSYISDVQDARKSNSANKGTFWMGVAILVTFAIIMFGVLYGCFEMASGNVGMKLDPGTAAVIFTLIGTIVGYAAYQAQTVINFEFGTSRGGSARADAMAQAVTDFTKIKS